MSSHIVLASHGHLAEGMLSAVEMIAGKKAYMSAYGLDTYQTPNKIYELIEEEIKKAPMDRFIICCDIKCGSIHNILVGLCEREQVLLVSGMNLALVLSLALSPEMEKEILIATMEEAKDNLMYFDKETILNSNLEEDKLW